MAKMNLLDALKAALEATKTYVDDNHYNQTEIDTLLDTKADLSHGTHVTWATNVPKANGTAAVGSVNRVAKEDHIHPLQTTVSGNAGSADKVNNNLVVKLNSGTTEGTNMFTFNGSAAKSIDITPGGIGAATSGHTHKYAGSSSAGGAATSANKVNSNLVIKINGGATEGTDLFTFNGSGAKTIDLTPSILGLDNRYYTETEIDAEFVEVRNEIQAVIDGFDEAIAGEKERAEGKEGELQTAINNESTRAKTAEAKALTDAKVYTDQKITALVDSAPDAMNTLNELATAINNHQDVYDAYVADISTQLSGKSDVGHTHNYAGSSSAGGAANSVKTNLTIKLNGGSTEGTNLFTFNGSTAKTIDITPSAIGAAASSHGTHVTYATATPLVAGTGAVGTSSKVAREDHVHPVQTSVSGNAGTATKFASAQSVALTGDVTGSASSQAGWSVTTTLSKSGVTAGSYGQAENASPAHKGTFSVPYITVDAKGRVTAASTKTITLPADNNTTYTNESLGNGYGTCATEAATTAKVVTLANYALQTGGQVSVKFTYAVPAEATMNINSRGAKSIFYKGAKIVAGVIKAGDIATFIYDGTQYQLIAIDRWQNDITTNASNLSTHTGNTTVHITAAERTAWNAKASTSVATTSANGLMSKDMVTKLNGIATGAEVNQNAFANVKVGNTTVAADAKQDTIEFVAGSNITITPDATNDKITIAATNTVYTHPTHTAYNSGLYKVTVNSLGHITAATAVSKSDITALGIPAQDTVYTHPSSGATAGSYGNNSNQTPVYGATFNVPYVTVDANGHVTAISNKTVKIPASDNTWRPVQNNLTSTSTSDSLSANQGKVLKGLVDTKADMVEDTALSAMLTEVFGTAE